MVTVKLLLLLLLLGRPAQSPDLLLPVYVVATPCPGVNCLYQQPAVTHARYSTALPPSFATAAGISFQVTGVARIQRMDSPRTRSTAVSGEWCSGGGGGGGSCCPVLGVQTCCARGCQPLDDVVTLFPSLGAAAALTVRVPLQSSHYGFNRLRAFVHTSAVECPPGHSASSGEVGCEPAYDGMNGAVFTARLERADGVLVRAVDLRGGGSSSGAGGGAAGPDFASFRGEWLEATGLFAVAGPAELGFSTTQLQLVVTFGAGTATRGRASLVELDITNLPSANSVQLADPSVTSCVRNNPSDCVKVTARNDQFGNAVNQVVLTDNVVSGPSVVAWSYLQLPPQKPVELVFDLGEIHRVTSVQIFFAYAGHVTEWTVSVALAGRAGPWTQVVSVNDPTWPQTVCATCQNWTAVSTQNVLGPDWNAASWDERMWQRYDLPDNPISEKVHRFLGQQARYVKLEMQRSTTNLYSIREFKAYGFEEDVLGPCAFECRHGGSCTQKSMGSCACVDKWGWQGPLCADDVDECTLAANSRKAAAREPPIIVSSTNGEPNANGGCGSGLRSKANCTNIPGSWLCKCAPGYTGLSTAGAPNTCSNIDECSPSNGKGGCASICLDIEGTYRCDCRDGYRASYKVIQQAAPAPTLAAAAGSWADGPASSAATADASLPIGADGTVLHQVTRLPLLGAACIPVCEKKCVSGSCISPNQCGPCDKGWSGQYCDLASCDKDKLKRVYKDKLTGATVTDFGCYHNGTCNGAEPCSGCLGGWAGFGCDQTPGAAGVVAIALTTAIVVVLCVVIVLVKRKWPPFQERGVAVVVLGSVGALIFALTSPAVAVPATYGIPLEVSNVQPDDLWWSLWLPYVLGFGLWFNASLVRVRTLVVIHLRRSNPISGVVQIFLPVLVLAGATAACGAFFRHELGFVGIYVLLGVYFEMLCCQLLPLRGDLDDLVPTMVCGSLALLTSIALMILRVVGEKTSYANPDGRINVIFPIVLCALILAHFCLTIVSLVWKLIRRDQQIMEKYAQGDDSSDEDEATGAKALWKKGFTGAKTTAILKLSAQVKPSTRKGGLLGMLKKKDSRGEDSSDDDSEESSEYGSEYESSSDESVPRKKPMPFGLQTAAIKGDDVPLAGVEEASTESGSDDSSGEHSTSDSNSSSGHGDDSHQASYSSSGTFRGGGRGGGRGGSGRGSGRPARGRWTRGMRASFRPAGSHPGRGGGRYGGQGGPVGGARGGFGSKQPTVAATGKDKAKITSAAALYKRVAIQLPVEGGGDITTAAADDDDLTTSSDSDLEELSAEVRRFEKMIDKKIGGKEGKGGRPGTMPAFHSKEIIGCNAPEVGMSLGLGLQKLKLERDQWLQDYDHESEMDKILNEPTEAEKAAALKPKEQRIVEESEEDMEVEVGGRMYLVDKESSLVFELVAAGDPPEVGEWDSNARLIVFSTQP